MDKNLISVIIPVYNCQKYVGRCLLSVINQTYGNIEIIIIDDGSTDSSLSVIKSRDDSRMKVINSRHRGVSIARNIGIENSNGDFIFFIDADDFLESDALELLMKNQNGADLVIGDFKKIREGDASSGNARVFRESKLLNKRDIIDYVKKFLTKTNKFPLFDNCWGKLFKAPIIKENKVFFDVNLCTSEDVAFNFDYLKYVEKVFFLNKPIYNHLVRDNFLSASLFFQKEPEELFGYRKAFNSVLKFFENCYFGYDIYFNVNKEIANAYVNYTIIQLIRCCGQITEKNREKIYKFIRSLVNETRLRYCLRFYNPLKGDSKIIPLLIKLKFIMMIIWICKYKARKRYKIPRILH